MARTRADVHADMLEKLVLASANYAELVEISGMTHDTVAAWVKPLRSRRLVVVSAWDVDSRGYPTVPRFRWDVMGTDALRPSVPPAERARALRKRRAEGGTP